MTNLNICHSKVYGKHSVKYWNSVLKQLGYSHQITKYLYIFKWMNKNVFHSTKIRFIVFFIWSILERISSLLKVFFQTDCFLKNKSLMILYTLWWLYPFNWIKLIWWTVKFSISMKFDHEFSKWDVPFDSFFLIISHH